MAIFTDGMKFKDITSVEQPSEAIEKGKVLINTDTGKMYLDKVSGTTRMELIPSDTALSTTSTNPIQNQALTNSIINTLSEAIAVTVDSIPCGTKAVKELNANKIKGSVGEGIIDTYDILYYTLQGTVVSGTTVEFGEISNEAIPAGKTFVSMIVTPQSSVPIIMMAVGKRIFAYSMSYNGLINYNCVIFVK